MSTARRATAPIDRPAAFRPRPAQFCSPYPPGECARRLAAVTTKRGSTTWYLDPANACKPAPRLRGTIDQSGILVARFEDATGRNSFAPYLDARLVPGADGGTVVTGRIGMHPNGQAVGAVALGFGALLLLGALAGGISQLAAGHLRGLPFVLLPIVLGAFIAAINLAGRRSLEHNTPKLIGEINAILASSATLPEATPGAKVT
jgi:hypothetical protein